MAEADSTPASDVANTLSDVANVLISELEAEAHYVDAGSFTLDPRKAREKLAAYQLAEPDRFVLLMVEAAHLLHRCKGVAFTIDTRCTKAVFEGVELCTSDLHGCFDALFIDVASLDPERARQMRGRQRLALALNTALGLGNVRIEMTSMIRGELLVHAVLDSEGRVRVREQPSASATSSFVVEIHQPSRWHEQRDLLRREARYGTMPIHLNGTRIDQGPSAGLVHAVDIRDVADQVVGRVGWCAAQARRESGGVAFVANGVVIETYRAPEQPIGVLALLDADDLQRDISHAKLQRDEAFFQRVAAVSTICLPLVRHVPTLGPTPIDTLEIAFGSISFLMGMVLLGCAVAFWWSFGTGLVGTALFVGGVGLCYRGIWLIRRARRRRHVRLHGHAGLGVIQAASFTRGGRAGIPEMWIDMLIERPEQDGYAVRFSQSMDRRSKHLVEPGKRVYVRIDPNDPNFVAFDPGDS
jgi:hypothetical protein